MTKQKSKAGKKPTVEIEIDPDAFERFRAAVHKLAKAGPKPKPAPKRGAKGKGKTSKPAK